MRAETSAGAGAAGAQATALRWAGLAALTIALTALFELARLSAALLIGAMGAAVVFAVAGSRLQPTQRLIQAAQAVIGCMIARALVPSILGEVLRGWPLFLASVASVIVAACVLGQLLTRWRVLPGTTALWGSFPGAATAMVFMAEEYGADMRLVAFMQYLRVVIVAILASTVARVYAEPSSAATGVVWLAPVAWPAFAATLAVALIGTLGGRLLRIPVAPLLGPMALAMALQNLVGLRIELPPLLLAVAYTVVGWNIGGRFTRDILRHALHALPRVAASILALVALCGGLAAALVVFAGVDPLTAYLATSPGGADSVAIIAASNKVDVPFVMALQVTRFLVILLVGPRLARALADRAGMVQGVAPPAVAK